MVFLAYTLFILIWAVPPMMAAAILALLATGVQRIFSAKSQQRVDYIGVVMVVAGLIVGTVSYQWMLGPKAELATLQPLVLDKSLASNLPRTWVYDYGGTLLAFDVLSHKYASRVLNSSVLDPDLSASIPSEKRDDFMEEIKLVNSPFCNRLSTKGNVDVRQTFKCLTSSVVSKSEVAAEGPYLSLDRDDNFDAQIINFGINSEGRTRLIARCIGRAPRESNSVLSMIRGNRSLDVASSMYDCRMRAASGALSRAIATGAIL